jgi:serine phosphatase RsbU (regulator of sigma subunit)/pSer/pThr/pTyr-binding forkhead associated (FHA) protein
MPNLIIESGSGSPRICALESGALTIGRDGMCEIVLNDLKASRRHARVTREEDGRCVVEDLGSKNGTFVGGKPIRRHLLSAGDRIEIGTTVLVFRETAGARGSAGYTIEEDTKETERASFVGRRERLLLPQRRLEMLSDLAERLVRLQNRGELLKEVMDICFETLRFERGLIALKAKPGGPPEEPIVRNLREDAAGRFTISRSILNRALDLGERTIINDSQAELVDPTVSIATNNIRSAMCVPLEYRGEILGVIYGDRISSTTQYDREDVDFLAALARQASIGLTNATLLEEHSRMVQLENELNVARQIQTGLFPPDFEPRAGLRIRAFNEPGRQVSGDYYDIVPLSGERVGLVIADVAGKGVAAALLMANLQAAVRVTLPEGDDLGELVGRWNRLICENTDLSKFVTLLLAVVNPQLRSVEIANAGHLPPYVLSGGDKIDTLAGPTHLPLGVEDGERYDTIERQFGTEEVSLFMCTDGVPEAMNEQEELFGERRMVEALTESERLSPEALIASVRNRVKRFSGRAPQSDDITILAVQLPTRSEHIGADRAFLQA